MVAQRFGVDPARRLFPVGERKLLPGPLRALRLDDGASRAHRHAHERDQSSRPPYLWSLAHGYRAFGRKRDAPRLCASLSLLLIARWL
jgi:hypothetical protein